MTVAKLVHRRSWLVAGAGIGAALVACRRDDTAYKPVKYFMQNLPRAPRPTPPVAGVDCDPTAVTAVEDLMREHGVVQRVLLVYEAAARRIEARDSPPRSVVVDAARLVREFVEDYHEKLEEELVFPRFEASGRLIDVVTTLRLQHLRGRALTDTIRTAAEAGELGDEAADRRLTTALHAFVHMYRPHAAREDTVVFPLLRELVTDDEYRELGEVFEEREHELFGAPGFSRIVDRVAELEDAFDIGDLAAQTA